jgi:hypothetical protein
MSPAPSEEKVTSLTKVAFFSIVRAHGGRGSSGW